MKYIKITLALLLVAFLATGSFAQKRNSTSEIDSLKKRIEKLEKELSTHDSGIRSIDYKLNFVHAKAVEAEEKAYKTERELWKEHFGLFELAFTLVVALLSFFGIKNRLEEKVKKKLDEIVKDPKRIEAMEAKIDKHLAENKFKEDIKLLVMSKDKESEKVIKNYLEENNFPKKNVIYNIGSEITLFNHKFDLLFINNLQDRFEIDSKPFDLLINEIKNKYIDLAVFYYNDNNKRLPQYLDEGLKSSFANSIASLYHNLIDLMRYKYLVIDGKNL